MSLASAAPAEHRGGSLNALGVTSQASSPWIRNSRTWNSCHTSCTLLLSDSLLRACFDITVNEKKKDIKCLKVMREKKDTEQGCGPSAHLLLCPGQSDSPSPRSSQLSSFLPREFCLITHSPMYKQWQTSSTSPNQQPELRPHGVAWTFEQESWVLALAEGSIDYFLMKDKLWLS